MTQKNRTMWRCLRHRIKSHLKRGKKSRRSTEPLCSRLKSALWQNRLSKWWRRCPRPQLASIETLRLLRITLSSKCNSLRRSLLRPSRVFSRIQSSTPRFSVRYCVLLLNSQRALRIAFGLIASWWPYQMPLSLTRPWCWQGTLKAQTFGPSSVKSARSIVIRLLSSSKSSPSDS